MRGSLGISAALMAIAGMGARVVGNDMGIEIKNEHVPEPVKDVRPKRSQARFYQSGGRDRSRYMPHQGAQEIARRVRQAESGFSNLAGRKFYLHQRDFLNAIDATGITIIPKTRIATKLATSKTYGEVQDSGNPVGKRVSWVSSNTEKVGEITHVVPAGKVPSDVGAKVKDAGTPRDHESFVVSAQVLDGPARGKPSTYWPRVSLLKFA